MTNGGRQAGVRKCPVRSCDLFEKETKRFTNDYSLKQKQQYGRLKDVPLTSTHMSDVTYLNSC